MVVRVSQLGSGKFSHLKLGNQRCHSDPQEPMNLQPGKKRSMTLFSVTTFKTLEMGFPGVQICKIFLELPGLHYHLLLASAECRF